MSQQDLFTGVFNDTGLYKAFYNKYRSLDSDNTSYFIRTFNKIYDADDDQSSFISFASQYAVAHLLFNLVLTYDSAQPYLNNSSLDRLFNLDLKSNAGNELDSFALYESLNNTAKQLFNMLLNNHTFNKIYNSRISITNKQHLRQTTMAYSMFSMEPEQGVIDENTAFRIIAYNILMIFLDPKNFKMMSQTNLKVTKLSNGILLRFQDTYGTIVKRQKLLNIHSTKDSDNNNPVFIKETQFISEILPTGII